jgi:hypothetical protein
VIRTALSALGIAVLAVVLQHQLTSRIPAAGVGLGAAYLRLAALGGDATTADA